MESRKKMRYIKWFASIIYLLFCNILIVKAQEKVALTTDRDIYIAGEDVWFGLGALEPCSNNNSQLSNVLYLELLNKKHVPIVQLKYCIEDSFVQSKFQLPDSLSSGKYYIRVYTRWMRNRDVSLFATKSLDVINPFAKNSMPKGDHYHLGDTVFCYVEGGKIVPDIRNKVILYACDKKGNPIMLRGSIQDGRSNILHEFVTEESGYDVVNIIPNKLNKYILSYGDEKVILPPVSNNKYLLQLKDSYDDIVFKINGFCDDNMRLDILSTGGHYLRTYEIPNNGIVRLARNEFQTIDMYALLVDDSKKIYAFRGFSNLYKENQLSISMDKEKYGLRSKVNVSIRNVSALKHLSVTAVKTCLLNKTFNNINALSADDKMLLKDKPDLFLNDSIILPEIEGELLEGKIIDLDTGNAITNEKFMLGFVSNKPALEFSKTDSLGRFRFVSNRYGDEEMVIQPKSTDTTSLNYKVILDDDFSTVYSNEQVGDLVMDSIQMQSLNEAIINMQINSIYGEYKTELEISDSIIKNNSFYNNPHYIVKIDKYIELPTMEEVIRELVPLTSLRKNQKGYEFKVFEDYSLYPKYAKTLVFVDGIPIKNTQNVFDIKPQDLERIEVVNLQSFLKDENLGYLLCFYTKDGNMADMEFDNRIFRQVHKGYNSEYEFKSPDYSDPKLKESRLADFRNVLYFDTVDESKNGENYDFSFYTSDDQSEYTIVVKGIDENGNWVTGRANFEVTN